MRGVVYDIALLTFGIIGLSSSMNQASPSSPSSALKFIFCALRPAADPMLRWRETDWSLFCFLGEPCQSLLDSFCKKTRIPCCVTLVFYRDALVSKHRLFMHAIIRLGDWSWGQEMIQVSAAPLKIDSGIDINSEINSSRCIYVYKTQLEYIDNMQFQ